MHRNCVEYKNCIKVLEEELLPATGCTEPIAVAYCAAVARKTLGCLPESVTVEASGNIIKNVKSVVVPNTNNMRGIAAAAAAGIIAGDPEKELEVISNVNNEQQTEIGNYINSTPINVVVANSELVFDIIVNVCAGNETAKVRIANHHTNIVLIKKNQDVLLQHQIANDSESNLTDRSFLSVDLIYDFANSVEIDDISEIIGRQIEYNMAISSEGLNGDYGANIGRVMMKTHEDIINNDTESALRIRAKAAAAAGSDARMNGCELPVVINSGSGNQGITVSVPVVTYAETMGISKEKMYRALVLSNLLGIHQKTPIGRLSAYCGAISAGAAAGCGIAYLKGADLRAISHTLVNALAIASGVICDGAKASCAAKIALAVETGMLGYEMFLNGQQFFGGDGIVKKGVENTITSVGRLGKDGMFETDKEILSIMIE